MSINGSATRNRRSGSTHSKSELPVTNSDADNISEEDESKARRVSAPSQFSCTSIVVMIGICILFAKYMDNRLPKPLMESDVPSNPFSFIEERARKDLEILTSVGVRVSGSHETDQLTVLSLLTILENITSTKAAVHNIEYEVQRPDGAFFMDSDEGHTSTYAKIANVIAKLEAADLSKRKDDAFLLNCHFDTKPGSPGATDNMISCAVMLETLRVLSRDESALPNTIIFLFNGAEELGLQGAHAFVQGTEGDTEKGHRWSKNVKAFVNLEGAGAGGREILFQTGPGNSWVLKAYSKAVPYPYGTCLAEEAFQRELIPSDTDFRIFRDFKNIPGLDMAFIKNGWVYHTKWDKVIEIPPGSIQHMGENALALVREFGQLDLEVEDSDSKIVFFDVLGGFMIRYSEVVGIIINVLVGVASVAFIYWREVHKKMKILQIVWLPVATIVSWGMGIVAAVLVALFLNGCGYYKPFYSYPSLSFVVFGVPAILGQTISFSFALKGNADHTWIAGKLTTAIITIIMTFLTRAVYVFTIILIFGVVGWFLSRWLCRGWPRAIVSSYLIIGEFVPFLLSSYLLITLADVFVPIMGRTGSETNANLFFGVIIAALISVLLFNGLTSIFVTYKKTTLITCFIISFFLINPMIVFGFIGKVPYQEKTPMRLNLVNVDRTWYGPGGVNETKTDAGYWFWPVDSNTNDFVPTFTETVFDLKNVAEIEVNSESCPDLYCAQPFLWPTTDMIKTILWVSKAESQLPPAWKSAVNMQYTDEHVGAGVRKLKLTFAGPTQLTIVLSPSPNYILTNWSLPSPVPPSGVKWNGRSTYFIYHSRGYEIRDTPFEFTCDFKTPEADSGPILDVQLSGFYLYDDGPGIPGSDFWKFTNEFPHWTNVMSWSTVLKLYTVY